MMDDWGNFCAGSVPPGQAIEDRQKVHSPEGAAGDGVVWQGDG